MRETGFPVPKREVAKTKRGVFSISDRIFAGNDSCHIFPRRMYNDNGYEKFKKMLTAKSNSGIQQSQAGLRAFHCQQAKFINVLVLCYIAYFVQLILYNTNYNIDLI